MPPDPTATVPPRVRVVVRSDPRNSPRALEALRVAAGLAAAGELEVEVQLEGPARRLAHRAGTGEQEYPEAEEYLRILRGAGGRVVAGTMDVPAGTTGGSRPKAVLRF